VAGLPLPNNPVRSSRWSMTTILMTAAGVIANVVVTASFIDLSIGLRGRGGRHVASGPRCHIPSKECTSPTPLLNSSKERRPNHGLAAGRGPLNRYRSNHDPG
jgi:hypothetical protein